MVSYLTPGAAASGNSTGVQDKISRLSMLAVLTVAMTTSSHTLKHHLAQQLLSYVYNYLSCLPLEEKVCYHETCHVICSTNMIYRRVINWLAGRE